MSPLEQTLKITNVLSDPTRLSIYEYITKNHKEVTVQDIAEEFHIHPNVARLHLTKLEDVGMLVSENRKTGRGGRPSRLYRLSDEVIELHFPFRDYKLLSRIALEAMHSLGKAGEKALYETGKRYAKELIENQLMKEKVSKNELTFNQKVDFIKTTMTILGFYPDIYIKEKGQKLYFQIFNCPFKEVAVDYQTQTCNMHAIFITGLLEALFDNLEVEHVQNMLDGCSACAYHVNIQN